MDDGFGHWLAGFIDGEGCFVIVRRNAHRESSTYTPQFRISVRDDDAAIIEEIRERTGIGRVHYGRARKSEHNRQGQAQWVVDRRADVLALVELLDRYPLRAKKKRDYAIWREAAVTWYRRESYRGNGLRQPHPLIPRMAEYKHELEQARQYAG